MSGIAALGSMYPMYNSYMNQAALSSLYDMDYNPMGMYGSIFGGGMMPFMPSFGGGLNYDSYFNNMKNYLNFTSDYNLQMVENQRRNELRINGTDEAIRNAASVLNEKIVANEQEQVQQAYRSYIEAVAAKYPGESEKNIIARAKSNYQQLYNSTITDDLRKYGHDNFTHGLYKGLTFGLYNKTTPEDNISQITGQPVSRWDKFKESAGLATGGAAVAGGGLFLAKNLGWLKKVPKCGWIYTGIIGAAAATAAIFGSK